MRRQLNNYLPKVRMAILTLTVLIVFVGLGCGKADTDTKTAQPPKLDVSTAEKKYEKVKLFINIIHTTPQGTDCPQLKYKSGELVNPCPIDEHWEIRAREKKYTLEELQMLLIVHANISRETPEDWKSPSNMIVQIRAGKSVPWHLVGKVMEVCGKALIWKIEFGPEVMPVYLPKDSDWDGVAEEVRVALIHNPIAPLVPAIQVGNKEFNEWEKFEAWVVTVAPSLVDAKIPMKISSDRYVPFQTVFKAIKVIRKCNEAVQIEFAAESPTLPTKSR